MKAHPHDVNHKMHLLRNACIYMSLLIVKYGAIGVLAIGVPLRLIGIVDDTALFVTASFVVIVVGLFLAAACVLKMADTISLVVFDKIGIGPGVRSICGEILMGALAVGFVCFGVQVITTIQR